MQKDLTKQLMDKVVGVTSLPHTVQFTHGEQLNVIFNILLSYASNTYSFFSFHQVQCITL